MRQMISGLIAAVAVMAAAPAMACGFDPCGQPQVYVAPVETYSYSGCNPCGGWGHERLADPVQQYYYVNQGPTYTGPGDWAPRPTYQEGGYDRPYYSGYNGGYRAHRHYRPSYPRTSYYHVPRANYHYGYHYGYAPRRAYAPQYSSRYAPAPYYGHRPLRRYY
jgi:hypothetical protein